MNINEKMNDKTMTDSLYLISDTLSILLNALGTFLIMGELIIFAISFYGTFDEIALLRFACFFARSRTVELP